MNNSLSQCPVCSHGVEIPAEKCSSCGYPFSGTEKEKSIFIAHHIMNKEHMVDTGKIIKQARLVLFIIGGLIILTGILTQQANPFSIAISIGVGSLFIFFGFLTKKEPFISILIPLILLLLNYAGMAVSDPLSIAKGILWKVLFIGVLLYSLINVWKAQKIKRETPYFNN